MESVQITGVPLVGARCLEEVRSVFHAARYTCYMSLPVHLLASFAVKDRPENLAGKESCAGV